MYRENYFSCIQCKIRNSKNPFCRPYKLEKFFDLNFVCKIRYKHFELCWKSTTSWCIYCTGIKLGTIHVYMYICVCVRRHTNNQSKVSSFGYHAENSDDIDNEKWTFSVCGRQVPKSPISCSAIWGWCCQFSARLQNKRLEIFFSKTRVSFQRCGFLFLLTQHNLEHRCTLVESKKWLLVYMYMHMWEKREFHIFPVTNNVIRGKALIIQRFAFDFSRNKIVIFN
jgi:hypothetical protein